MLNNAHEAPARLYLRGRALGSRRKGAARWVGLLLFSSLLLWSPTTRAHGNGPSPESQKTDKKEVDPSELQEFVALSLGFVFTPEPDEASRVIGIVGGQQSRLGLGWTAGLRFVNRPPAVPALTSLRQDYGVELFAGPHLYLGTSKLPIRVRLGADFGVLYGPSLPAEEGAKAPTLVLPFIRPSLGLGFLLGDCAFVELAGGLTGLSAPTSDLTAGIRF